MKGSSRNKLWPGTFFGLCIVACLVQVAKPEMQRLGGGKSLFLKLIWECSKKDDIGICLKWKIANGLDRIVRMNEPLSITNYLSLVKTPKPPGSKVEDENRTQRSAQFNLWGTNEEKNEKLNEIILDRFISLLSTKTFQVAIPRNAFEGRGKEGKIFKKSHGWLLWAGMMGSMLIKLALAKIAVVAGAALIIGKIALILSIVLAVRRAVTGNLRDAEFIYANNEQAQNGWQRNFNLQNADGTSLAYNAYNHLHLKQP